MKPLTRQQQLVADLRARWAAKIDPEAEQHSAVDPYRGETWPKEAHDDPLTCCHGKDHGDCWACAYVEDQQQMRTR